MRVAVFGVGGVGGYFGARMAQAGHDVVFIARGAHLAAIRSAGLTLRSPLGDCVISPAQATDRPEDQALVDAVVLGVKAWQIEEASTRIRPLLHATTPVLPLQNGVGAPEAIDRVLGPGRALGGATWVWVRIAAPGVVEHLGVEPRVSLGELSGEKTPRVIALAAALEAGGTKVDLSTDIRRVMWTKFVFMAATSAVGSASRVSIGEVRGQPETRRLLRQAMEEVVAVARADGVGLDDDVVEQTMAFVDGLPHEATSSMQRDMMSEKPSELDAQSGTLVRMGRQLGVPMPVHSVLYAALSAQERRARQAVLRP